MIRGLSVFSVPASLFAPEIPRCTRTGHHHMRVFASSFMDLSASVPETLGQA
jgi:hypothetical protein